MSEKWVLVPEEATPQMIEADLGYYKSGQTWEEQIISESYKLMLAARPPVSHEWLDAAVERGAKAMCRLEGSRIPGDMGCAECEGECDVLDDGLSDLARAAILAALEMTDG